MGLEPTDSLAVLDALTPDPGWETDVAFLSTYSVDLVAAAAVVMAMAGEGDDHERMQKASLARACERMRDRFRILCQAGRVSVPQSGTTGLVLADRWIREIRHNGNEKSWHAKVALVRHLPMPPVSGEPTWRLWLGSRNLTTDTSWDTAIVAIGTRRQGTDDVDASIARMGDVLAALAGVPGWPPDRLREELAQVHWEWPADVVRVVSFSFWPDADKAPGLPRAPKGLRHLVAVSPFVDGSSATSLAKWGSDTKRQLLTTHQTLATLASQKGKPLRGFSSLHALDGEAPSEGGTESRDETGVDQMVELHRGLHAKILYARAADGDHIWMGSANLTDRAWGGKNTELVVHLMTKPGVGDGLLNGVVNGLAVQLPAGSDFGPTPGENPISVHLDWLRNRIAASWDARMIRLRDGEGYRCILPSPPLDHLDKASLSASFLGQPDALGWLPGASEMLLPPVPPPSETELLVLDLCSTEDPAFRTSWVARAPLDPPPALSRDRSVLARMMGPRAFLAWLRALLDEAGCGNEEDLWPEPKQASGGNAYKDSSEGRGPISAPTLEAVLRAWARDPATVQKVDIALQTWAKEFRDSVLDDPDETEQRALFELARFEEAWAVLRRGLDLGVDAS